MNYTEKAREVLDIEIAGLVRVKENLSTEFDRAVELVLERLRAGGKIVVTGVGKNLPIGRKIAATFTSTGCPAVFVHPSDAMHGDLGILQKADVLLTLSYSGESEELVALLPIVKRLGIVIVSISGSTDNAMARHSDVVIPVTVEREACPFNMAPTASTTATLAVGDALAMVLLEARGFRKEDFAKLHPGGAIGRTLLLRVADIMRTADRVAQVKRNAKVKDAVLAMTSARAGSVAVTEDDGRLIGIFTDGDLRRHITGSQNLAAQSIVDVMTANPITLTENHLAVDVLAIFERHNIDDLIIVNDRHQVVGMVDIQDLPKFKIF
ncbi:MAG: Arabinose 5-phosphate isomerase KdsD [Verrucomicrobia bacterium ADurb.Bin345]|nr:MAG: Arabinose 5-phosphate isomerase KdsD [Verrucomicrobia bacterium ADurb.Bin345]